MRSIQSVLPVSHQAFPDHEQSVPTINSHALHRFLGINDSPANWIGYRIKQLFLIENQDILVIRKIPGSKTIIDAYLRLNAVTRVLQYERSTALAYGSTRQRRTENGKNVIDEKVFLLRKKQRLLRAAHCDAALEYLADLDLQPADLRSDQFLPELPACNLQAQMELVEMNESPKASVEASASSQSLVQVTEQPVGGRVRQTVDARELHAFLGVGKVFAAWIQDRVKQFEFVENKDFVIDFPNLENQSGRGGDRRTKNYHLTLDMAKELSMIERTPKGKEARQYFIECERKLWEGETPATVPSPARGPTESPCRLQYPAASLPVIDADTVQSVQSMIPVLQLHREYLRNFREMGLELREALDAVTATMERQGIRIREIIDLPQIVR